MLNLSYKETEALFRLLHDVPEAKTRALFARFKAFQQLDFPHREGVGRGSRVGYTFDQMLQLVSAFELLEAGAMPQRAARAVMTSWPAQRAAYAMGWAAFRNDASVEDSDLLVSAPLALAEMGSEPEPDAAVSDPLRPLRRSEVAAWLTPSTSDLRASRGGRLSGPTRLVLDPMRVAAAVCDCLPQVAAVDENGVDAAFNALGVEAFGVAAPKRWAAARRKIA